MSQPKLTFDDANATPLTALHARPESALTRDTAGDLTAPNYADVYASIPQNPPPPEYSAQPHHAHAHAQAQAQVQTQPQPYQPQPHQPQPHQPQPHPAHPEYHYATPNAFHAYPHQAPGPSPDPPSGARVWLAWLMRHKISLVAGLVVFMVLRYGDARLAAVVPRDLVRAVLLSIAGGATVKLAELA